MHDDQALGENPVCPSDSGDSDCDDFPLLRVQMEASWQEESLSQDAAPAAAHRESDGGQENTFLAKDGTRWSSEPPASMGRLSAENVFRVPRNQTPGCEGVKEPVDAFGLFCCKALLESIVKYTNLEGIHKKGEKFIKTNETEMRAFVGCLLFLGALKQNMLPTTVVFAAFFGQELVRAAFSRKLFFCSCSRTSVLMIKRLRMPEGGMIFLHLSGNSGTNSLKI